MVMEMRWYFINNDYDRKKKNKKCCAKCNGMNNDLPMRIV
jgi:hypothetical protein